MGKSERITVFVVLVICLCAGIVSAEEQDTTWPRRVLITNDNGIMDPKIIALGVAFSRVAETYIVAPVTNRSGTTNFLGLSHNEGRLSVELVSSPETRLKIYKVDGYPADCVALGVLGIMADNPPDLVVSGINGGANLAYHWFSSGTVGAARTAATLGIPAIAVSGLSDNNPASMQAVPSWIVSFAQADIVRAMEPGRYITISLPRIHPSEIKGFKVVSRAGFTRKMAMKQVESDGNKSVWELTSVGELPPPAPDTDQAVWEDGYIAIVPMNVNEVDPAFMDYLLGKMDRIPAWVGHQPE